MRTVELAGAQLDYWVAKAEKADLSPEWNQGDDYVMMGGHSGRPPQRYHPSSNWEQGGPIIERRSISLEHIAGDLEWRASIQFGQVMIADDEPLRAAMLALVILKFGLEVPDEQL
jgi:hypothetical protein